MTRFTTFILLAVLMAFAVGCKKKSEDTGGGGDAGGTGGGSTLEQTRVQGTWEIEKLDILFSDEPQPPESEKFFDAIKAELQKASITIKDNQIIVTPPNPKDSPKTATFTLDATKSPKWVDASESEKDQPKKATATTSKSPPPTKEEKPEKALGIYKFEGEKLVVAFGMAGAPRPTEFKAVAPKKGAKTEKESGMVAVVYLKKK